jgi:hypothetical protein
MSQKKPKVLLCMYSEEVARKHGTARWVDKRGREYECTAIYSNPDKYPYDDKVIKGSVVKPADKK